MEDESRAEGSGSTWPGDSAIQVCAGARRLAGASPGTTVGRGQLWKAWKLKETHVLLGRAGGVQMDGRLRGDEAVGLGVRKGPT